MCVCSDLSLPPSLPPSPSLIPPLPPYHLPNVGTFAIGLALES